jgi:hypothetical protein
MVNLSAGRSTLGSGCVINIVAIFKTIIMGAVSGGGAKGLGFMNKQVVGVSRPLTGQSERAPIAKYVVASSCVFTVGLSCIALSSTSI